MRGACVMMPLLILTTFNQFLWVVLMNTWRLLREREKSLLTENMLSDESLVLHRITENPIRHHLARSERFFFVSTPWLVHHVQNFVIHMEDAIPSTRLMGFIVHMVCVVFPSYRLHKCDPSENEWTRCDSLLIGNRRFLSCCWFLLPQCLTPHRWQPSEVFLQVSLR